MTGNPSTTLMIIYEMKYTIKYYPDFKFSDPDLYATYLLSIKSTLTRNYNIIFTTFTSNPHQVNHLR